MTEDELRAHPEYPGCLEAVELWTDACARCVKTGESVVVFIELFGKVIRVEFKEWHDTIPDKR